MKINDGLIKLFFFCIVFTIMEGQTKTSSEDFLMNELPFEKFEKPILNSNNFSMHQSFSLSTLTTNQMSQTMGIFSNFTQHGLSNKLQIKTAFHLITNNNNFTSYAKPDKLGFGYELGLEYKLSPNSLFSFQIMNYKNSSNIQSLNSIINVP